MNGWCIGSAPTGYPTLACVDLPSPAFASEHESLPLVLHQVVDGMGREVLRAEGDSTDETLGVRRQAHKAGIGLDYSLASYS
jgi:hypothetical protein